MRKSQKKVQYMKTASLHLINAINKTKSGLALFFRFLSLKTNSNDNKDIQYHHSTAGKLENNKNT